MCNTFIKKKEIHNKLKKRALVQTVTYEAESWGMRNSEKVQGFEIELFMEYMCSDQYW